MFLVRRSAASSGRGSGGFLWKEHAENTTLRQRLHDRAQIKDDTRVAGDRHDEIALLLDGVALALGMRRSGAKQGGTAIVGETASGDPAHDADARPRRDGEPGKAGEQGML